MSNEQGSSSNSGFKIPSLEEIERRKLQKKQLPYFNRPTTITSTTAPSTATTTTTTTATNITSTTSASTTRNNTIATASSSTSTTNNTTRPPQPQPARKVTSTSLNTILVNPSQQKNPILKHIHNVPWEPSESIKVDYVVGQTTGIIYLSLRYHRLYPAYIYDRLSLVKQLYVNRILLVYVDIENYHDALREINRVAILSQFTLILAWSLEEAGRYLETYRIFESKPPDVIREHVDDDYMAKMTDGLTQIRSVNKTDVLTLLSTFGSLKQIVDASTDRLAVCPGFGEQKVKSLQKTWKQPFLANKKQRK